MSSRRNIPAAMLFNIFFILENEFYCFSKRSIQYELKVKIPFDFAIRKCQCLQIIEQFVLSDNLGFHIQKVKMEPL